MGGVLGWLINAAIFAPLRERGSELLPLIATIGVSIMLQNAMLLLFGPIPYAFNTPYSSTVIRIGSLFFTLQNLLIIVVSATTIALLYAFMKFTFLGKALRAVSQDRETAALVGINPNFLIMLTFIIASALAGMSGALLGPVLVLTPFAGHLGHRQSLRHRHHRRFWQRRGHDHRWAGRRLDRKLHHPIP